jgi:hypothetical protein
MLWLVWGLPALVVVAGLATLAIAIRSGGADAVTSEVRRTAQIQVEDLGADREALRLGLNGELQRTRDTGALRLVLADAAAGDAVRLQLRLRHPSHAAHDREVPLVRGDGAWLGRLDAAPDQAWNLELQPPDGRWRLSGRLEADAAAASLRPRLRE